MLYVLKYAKPAQKNAANTPVTMKAVKRVQMLAKNAQIVAPKLKTKGGENSFFNSN
jgi:hypothetical protein